MGRDTAPRTEGAHSAGRPSRSSSDLLALLATRHPGPVSRNLFYGGFTMRHSHVFRSSCWFGVCSVGMVGLCAPAAVAAEPTSLLA